MAVPLVVNLNRPVAQFSVVAERDLDSECLGLCRT